MKRFYCLLVLLCCWVATGARSAAPQDPKTEPPTPGGIKLPAAEGPPTDWIEASGHRVLRLSRDPGTSSFYFHQNAYTAAGDKMVVATRAGLATIDLTTLGTKPPKIEVVVEG